MIGFRNFFRIGLMRSHYCGEPGLAEVDETVELCGWVNRRRDHGGVIFIDLRDRSGLVQVVYDPDVEDVFATAEKVRTEYVLRVKGRVRRRPEGTVNPDISTGEIEVLGKELEILNAAKTPPFVLDDEDVSEELRLRYRYVDLRRPEMLQRMQLRSTVTRLLREYLDNKGFLDMETPMLTKATPEGARDYLVPSRTHAGKFFALPQSPQLFKQLLMMSGMDRYYQIVRCFRDEDLRADRQPEFTQLDVEMSFLDEEQIMQLMEEMIRGVFKGALDVDLPEPFPRMTWAEAMDRFAAHFDDVATEEPEAEIPVAKRLVNYYARNENSIHQNKPKTSIIRESGFPILKMQYPGILFDELLIRSTVDFTLLQQETKFKDIQITNQKKTSDSQLETLGKTILQALGIRHFKTDFIACPSCGRTQFNLIAALEKVKKQTSHLKNLTIAVMGCIVNGPGEMADADYGYVGAGAGKVTIYKGSSPVLKNIEEKEAIQALIDLIKKEGDWVEEKNTPAGLVL